MTSKLLGVGIDGMPRMRLVRDDIAARVMELAVELIGGR